MEDLERNLEGFTQSVKTVMRESTRGNLRGIHGPVTRLLKVPREYAVALETALGAAMQNVVVDSEDAAKAAIRLLKQRDSGRATFLPLTTVRGTVIDARDVQNMPGFVGVASTLCHCDEQYAGIRDSLLAALLLQKTLTARRRLHGVFGSATVSSAWTGRLSMRAVRSPAVPRRETPAF